MKATWYQQESQAVGAPPARTGKHQMPEGTNTPLGGDQEVIVENIFSGELGQSVVWVSEGVNTGAEVGAANVDYSLQTCG